MTDPIDVIAAILVVIFVMACLADDGCDGDDICP